MQYHCDYMDIGIRELKSRLSEFVERAARGQVIRVTERGKPKAILGPLPGQFGLERGLSEGWITAGSGDVPAPARRRHKATRSIDEVLAEDRGA
jgi:prevent-host-death family protein